MGREESSNSNLARRPESAKSNNFENDDENTYLNSSAEINRYSSELNSRISRKMNEMMNNVSVEIQRPITDALSNQVLPQIQKIIMACSGHMTNGFGQAHFSNFFWPFRFTEVRY